MDRVSLSCFLIGADSLLIECGDVLRERGHAIRGVISAAPRVVRWARQHGLAVLDPAGDYRAALDAEPFDYLFAITHLAIIPTDVLAKPRRGAINFHDGPLPRYAGLNAPAWALIHREREHGVTWHEMTAEVDAGRILKQRRFEIAEQEIALTLNTRCFELGLETFAELIDELAEGRAQYHPQDLSERSVFSRDDRPLAACLLNFQHASADLVAMVRALDFGRYPNPLGSAKIAHRDQLAIVTHAQAVDDVVGEHVGQILTIDDERLRVATQDGAIDLLAFTDLEGHQLTLSQVVERLDLDRGVTLDTLTPEHTRELTELTLRMARHEAYWAERLATLDPARVPSASGDACPLQEPQWGALPIAVPFELCAGFDSFAPSEVLAAAWSVLLARRNDRNVFDLAWSNAALGERTGSWSSWFAPAVPWRVELHWDESFADHVQRQHDSLARLAQRGTYLRDLVSRRPELATPRPLSVAIHADSALSSFQPQPLTALALLVARDGRSAQLVYDQNVLSAPAATLLQQQFLTLLSQLAVEPRQCISQLQLVSSAERHTLEQWNATAVEYPREMCIHQAIEQRVAQMPDAVALVCEDESLTYQELNRRANQLAAHLRALGVGPDRLVGIHLLRSTDLVVSILAVHKAGGAYVPLDPLYPADRIALMIEDAALGVILSETAIVGQLPVHAAEVVLVDADWPQIACHSEANEPTAVTNQQLAYVIYTSGSTGKPKGVMIEHRNAINFFAGMDERIVHEPPGVWLAVTSLSFDISVLELLWTLSRGFKVVLFRDRDREATAPKVSVSATPIDFSLFYFSGDDCETGDDKYRLLLDGARYADQNGFIAVWTPERHFHAFGGLYPHPAVTSAAVATITERVQIRAGSVVLPLHHPARVAEAWSVVDNLSHGRVGVAMAAGWQPNDFVLMPQNYGAAKDAMFRDIEVVRRLWSGTEVEFPGPTGAPVTLRTLPRPIQSELPIWITTAGNVETYIEAGRIGANVLTHLLGQSVEELAPKIAAYRAARAAAGFDPTTGIVSLMLHTFVGPDEAAVREQVRGPLQKYLSTSLNLLKKYAWSFPAFKRPENLPAEAGDEFQGLTSDEQQAVLDHAFDRYYESSGLFGSADRCLAMIERLKGIGVNEVACLIDFGVPTPKVLEHLRYLNELRKRANSPTTLTALEPNDYSIAAQIVRHGVTHFQCTPSMARMLLAQAESRDALGQVRHMLLGGEAFPLDLARELTPLIGENVLNMYGPTETTVWSTTQRVKGAPDMIPIGRPIANTRLYILDGQQQPVSIGCVGELYIGGDSVARGYLNRPELTAQRFVNDSFVAERGARMYRTGDLARYGADGVVEFLGRVDQQIKIRGYRVELGEIEARFSEYPGVRQCVVTAHEFAPGDQRLVAYLVSDVGEIAKEALRNHLRQSLPEFMVPAHYMYLDELPLTPNGKIDRRALPAPRSTPKTASVVSRTVPGNTLEAKLVQLWQNVLGRGEVGIDDNFFDVGGHSLLVVRLHRQLAKVIDAPVSLTDLYRFPTIRSLVVHLTNDREADEVRESAQRGQQRREKLMARRQKSRLN